MQEALENLCSDQKLARRVAELWYCRGKSCANQEEGSLGIHIRAKKANQDLDFSEASATLQSANTKATKCWTTAAKLPKRFNYFKSTPVAARAACNSIMFIHILSIHFYSPYNHQKVRELRSSLSMLSRLLPWALQYVHHSLTKKCTLEMAESFWQTRYRPANLNRLWPHHRSWWPCWKPKSTAMYCQTLLDRTRCASLRHQPVSGESSV